MRDYSFVDIFAICMTILALLLCTICLCGGVSLLMDDSITEIVKPDDLPFIVFLVFACFAMPFTGVLGFTGVLVKLVEIKSNKRRRRRYR